MWYYIYFHLIFQQSVLQQSLDY